MRHIQCCKVLKVNEIHFPLRESCHHSLFPCTRFLIFIFCFVIVQVLTVQHPLEESRDSLAFATEPVFASLANVLGHTDSAPSPLPPQLCDYKLYDIEIKYGLMQVRGA